MPSLNHCRNASPVWKPWSSATFKSSSERPFWLLAAELSPGPHGERSLLGCFENEKPVRVAEMARVRTGRFGREGLKGARHASGAPQLTAGVIPAHRQ